MLSKTGNHRKTVFTSFVTKLQRVGLMCHVHTTHTNCFFMFVTYLNLSFNNELELK